MLSVKNIIDLLEQQNLDAMLLTSDVNIAYATGMCDLEGVIFIAHTGKAYCFTDSRYIEYAQNSIGKLGYSVQTVSRNDYFSFIADLCKEFSINSVGFEDEKTVFSTYKLIEEKLPCKLVAISKNIKDKRAVKAPEEVENIVRAQRIAEKAFDVLLGEIKPGQTENECKARLEYLMSIYGSEKTAFDTILISGTKTSMPHGKPGDKVLRKGEFVTVDFGAVYGGYCSDMTRTFALGKVDSEMIKVYETVLNANLSAIEKADIGVSAFEVDKTARDIITKAGYGDYFGHATGHGVGLEVHEAPSVGPKSLNKLETGNIITVEPGVYIPGVFGVRIEDMLYFSPRGKENLTKFNKNLIIL